MTNDTTNPAQNPTQVQQAYLKPSGFKGVRVRHPLTKEELREAERSMREATRETLEGYAQARHLSYIILYDRQLG